VSVEGTYAEALYEAAVDRNALDVVAADLEAFRQATEASPELARVLADPEIESRTKKAALAALAGEAHPLVRNFLQVLVDRGRIAEFADLARAFAERVAEAEGRITVEAVTAVALPDDLRQQVVGRLAGETGREVDLTETVDPDIVGGLVLRAGGVVVDGSVAHQLEELRRKLTQAPVETAT
jgi:F-type H+-transporting ATPase subunit delta